MQKQIWRGLVAAIALAALVPRTAKAQQSDYRIQAVAQTGASVDYGFRSGGELVFLWQLNNVWLGGHLTAAWGQNPQIGDASSSWVNRLMGEVNDARVGLMLDAGPLTLKLDAAYNWSTPSFPIRGRLSIDLRLIGGRLLIGGRAEAGADGLWDLLYADVRVAHTASGSWSLLVGCVQERIEGVGCGLTGEYFSSRFVAQLDARWMPVHIEGPTHWTWGSGFVMLTLAGRTVDYPFNSLN